MVSSLTEYISYFEAGEDMTDAEYGQYMRAIHNFAYKDIEPDYSTLSPLVKAALRTVIASVRKNKEDRENGAKGGRPNRVSENTKGGLLENKNPGYEKSETNVNENVKENVKENVNTHNEKLNDYVCENLSGFGKAQVDCFELVQKHNATAPKERKIPCSTNRFSFIQKEMRELLKKTGTNIEPQKLTDSLANFIKVAKSDTWQKTFSWRSFCNNFENFMPEFFTLSKYLNTEPQTDDATQKPEYKFYMRMKDNPRFSIDLFQDHIEDWKAEGRPEGADYFRLQNTWEVSECF